MIGRVRGVLADLSPTGVVVDVHGVGYDVAVSSRGLAELPPLGEEIVLHTHLHVREDQLALFGFPTVDQRELFRLLIGVSGVGPKVALAILGTLSVDELRAAVVSDDVAALTSVPGIGKRSAQKLLLDLRPRLEVPDIGFAASGSVAEVRVALEGLGYGSEEIRVVLTQMPTDLPVESLLKQSLQALGKQGGGS
jgi:Holliday junction DNA helicase RuvA